MANLSLELFFSGALVLFLILMGITAKRKDLTSIPTAKRGRVGTAPKAENKIEADKLEPGHIPKLIPKPTPESESEATLEEKNA